MPCCASCGTAQEKGLKAFLLQGKPSLLPLRRAEERSVIFPCKPAIQASEMKNMVSLGMGATSGVTKSGGQRQSASSRHPPYSLLGSRQVRELLETVPVLLLLLVLCGLDWALYSVFDTIRQHSFLQYSFRSEPQPKQSLHPAFSSMSPLPFCDPVFLLPKVKSQPPQRQLFPESLSRTPFPPS